jgi:acetyltransferase
MLGEMRSQAARAALARARYPTFRNPENAISAFAYLVDWTRNQALSLESPTALSSYTEPNTVRARNIIDNALQSTCQQLKLPQAKELLEAFHIPVTPSLSAGSPTEAVAVANRLGYPVAMKEATGGAMRLALRSAAEVALSFREICSQPGATVHIEHFIDRPHGRGLRISIRRDILFGPVISLSETGIAPEIYQARSIALPPLNPRLVSDLMDVSHIARLLGPLQHMPAAAQPPLRTILLRVSEMASELPWLRSLDMTLEVDERDAVAIDVTIELQEIVSGGKRYDHMAIYPYPSQLVTQFALKDKRTCTIRPIRPGDAAHFQEFVRALKARSRYSRFFSSLNELSPRSLARYTQIDYGRELTLIATIDSEDKPELLGEANYSCLPGGKICEFAIVIADDLGGLGLGSGLMRCLMAAAREQEIQVMRGEVLANNEAMLALMEALDFDVRFTDDEGIVEVTRQL